MLNGLLNQDVEEKRHVTRTPASIKLMVEGEALLARVVAEIWMFPKDNGLY